MSYTTPLAYLESKLEEQRRYHKDFLSAGKADTYEEYRRMVGVLQGLDFSIELIKDLANRLERDDE
jgi:hypothetical protein